MSLNGLVSLGEESKAGLELFGAGNVLAELGAVVHELEFHSAHLGSGGESEEESGGESFHLDIFLKL